jgi:hypothetical protein
VREDLHMRARRRARLGNCRMWTVIGCLGDSRFGAFPLGSSEAPRTFRPHIHRSKRIHRLRQKLHLSSRSGPQGRGRFNFLSSQELTPPEIALQRLAIRFWHAANRSDTELPHLRSWRVSPGWIRVSMGVANDCWCPVLCLLI